MLPMISPTLAVYKDVIDDFNEKRINIRLEHLQYQFYKGGMDISQPKRYHKELIVTISNPKYGLRYVLSPNSQLMVIKSEINLIKHFDTLRIVKRIINVMHKVFFLHYHLIQLTIINIHVHRTILRFHKQNGRTPRCYDRSNESLT